MDSFIKKIKTSWLNTALVISFGLNLFIGGVFIANLNVKADDKDPASTNISKNVKGAKDQPRYFGRKPSESENANNIAKVDTAIYRQSSDYSTTPNPYDDDPDGDGLSNYLEQIHNTNPNDSDTDQDGHSDKQEITNGYDPDAPGDAKPTVEISIKKISVTAPMIWTQSEKEADMMEDLKKGVIHLPDTASPGQNGNMIITGHSSNYVWVKGDYNHIFENLNNVEKDDLVSIKTTQQNGSVIIYTYKITDKEVTTADDQDIFKETPHPTLTISTCWPIGTNLKRLIVRASLIKQ